MKIVSGNSNIKIAKAIAEYLKVPLVKASIKKFPDKEIFVEIQENVRGEDVFVIQSTSFPANDNLMELLITIDALKRGSANRISAIMPYYGYARQDRKSGPRTPISAKLVANLISIAGANRALMVDLHAGQIQGFFDIPTDNLYAAPVFIKDIKNRLDVSNTIIVSPDVGGVVRASAIAKKVACDLAQHSDMFGQIASSHTVTTLLDLNVFLTFLILSDCTLTLIHSGFGGLLIVENLFLKSDFDKFFCIEPL